LENIFNATITFSPSNQTNFYMNLKIHNTRSVEKTMPFILYIISLTLHCKVAHQRAIYSKTNWINSKRVLTTAYWRIIHRWSPADFSKTAHIWSNRIEILSTVTYGPPIKKYAQFTLSADRVTSFFQILNDFLDEIWDTNMIFIR
jgi:hypothetical protein